MNPSQKCNPLVPVLFICLAALLCSCASTSLKKTWKSPTYTAGPIWKIAVLAVDERGDVRRALEWQLCNEIQRQGATAIASSDFLTLSEIKENKEAAAEKLRAKGAEAILIMRLYDVATFYHEYRPGPEQYADVITGYQPDNWYGYYTVAFAAMSPTYGSTKQKVYLESSLFDLKTSGRVWSALTLTTVTETMDRLAEIYPITSKVVGAMRKDGVVP